MRTVTTPSPSQSRDKRTKADLFINENPEELDIIRQHNRVLNKIPLRIDARTVVMVKPELCTSQHAAKLRAKFEKARKQFT